MARVAGTDAVFSADEQALLAEIEPQSFWFNHRNDVIAAVVERFPPPGPIYDIGGGNGYVSLGLQNAGFASIVVEPSEAGVATAGRRGVPVFQSSLQSIADSPESITSAGIFDVLEHVEDDSAALATLHRSLIPGGRLYVTVPAYGALWSMDDVEAGHFRRYTRHNLQAQLTHAGFSIEYATYFFAPLVIPVLFMRTVSRRKAQKTQIEVTADHRLPRGLIGSCMRHALRHELRIISRGGTVGLGTSCLAIARKSAE